MDGWWGLEWKDQVRRRREEGHKTGNTGRKLKLRVEWKLNKVKVFQTAYLYEGNLDEIDK